MLLNELINAHAGTVQAVYAHINHTLINFLHGKFNCKYLIKPWQDELGFVTTTTMMLPNSVKENKLLSWKLIRGSHTCVNKLFVAIKTVKYVA